MFAIKDKVTGEYMRNLKGHVISHNSLDVVMKIIEMCKEPEKYTVCAFLCDDNA